MIDKVKPDAFGTDEQFEAYLKQSRRQQKLVVIVIIAIVIMALASCATSKPGCPDSARWERKTAFNK